MADSGKDSGDDSGEAAPEVAATHGRRRIRSFVRREGRLTPSQKRALEELLPRFGIEFATRTLDLDAAFARKCPGKRVLEIGFGNGELLADLATQNPDNDYLGIEVHSPGVGHLLLQIEQRGLSNVRIISHDAVDVLARQLPAAALDAVLLFFPDPWPKKRHHKRRIVQPAFVELVADRLKTGGLFHLATDWQNYAEQMLEVMQGSPEFDNSAPGGGFAERPASRPVTKFERRGQRLGHGVWDLLYRRR